MDTQPLALAVDYYELLNLAPAHLFPAPDRDWSSFPTWDGGLVYRRPYRFERPPAPDELLTPLDVDLAAERAAQAVLSAERLDHGARALRLAEIEIGRRILRDPDLRRRYDATRAPQARGDERAAALCRLRELQEQVRAEIARAGGAVGSAGDGAALLAQGLGDLRAGRYLPARDALRRAAELLPTAAAQLAYARAALAAADPLTLGAFELRGLERSLARAAAAEPDAPGLAALRLLVAGLLARESGDSYSARQQLAQAADLQPNLAPAWRGLAALDLAAAHAAARQTNDLSAATAFAAAADAARRAFAADERDEAPLHLLIAAAHGLARPDLAAAAARQIAALRGPPWTTEGVLREVLGAP